MIRKFFVVWFDRSRSARARSQKEPRQNLRKARGADPGPRTPSQPLHFTEHKTRLSWKSRSTQLLPHIAMFLKDQLLYQQPAKKHRHIPRFFQAPREAISKEPCKNARVLLYRASKEHCKNAMLLLHGEKYTNKIRIFKETDLFHQQQQPARNIRSLNTKRIPKLFHWSPAQERTRRGSSLWPRSTVPELPSGTRGCKTSICLALITSRCWVFGPLC